MGYIWQFGTLHFNFNAGLLFVWSAATKKDVLLSALCSISNFIFGTELDQYVPVFLVDYQ